MLTEIQKELARLEAQHDIKITYAVESGSRAWGFASTDSDWDVRYIYIHKREWYLQIDDLKDNQEEILPNDIDLAGWELRKALRLFRKANPPLFEWLLSPIVYAERFSTARKMRGLMREFFNPVTCVYHYMHMASGNYKAYLAKDMVKVKKYFYALRPVLACDWIRETGTMAPMEFQTLVDGMIRDPELKRQILDLLARKMAGEELNEEPRIEIINEFLAGKIAFYDEYVKTAKPNPPPNTGLLNTLFRETLDEAWQ
ncbi:MAG: nucleotidyltransferase domain-containing protein [Kiritimatiellaeota bacterium]|nr:nucleotidyltransferase domain-containing protein [Kiritimatiellota bacterium]